MNPWAMVLLAVGALLFTIGAFFSLTIEACLLTMGMQAKCSNCEYIILPAPLQKLVGDCFGFGEEKFVGNLAGICRFF